MNPEDFATIREVPPNVPFVTILSKSEQSKVAYKDEKGNLHRIRIIGGCVEDELYLEAGRYNQDERVVLLVPVEFGLRG